MHGNLSSYIVNLNAKKEKTKIFCVIAAMYFKTISTRVLIINHQFKFSIFSFPIISGNIPSPFSTLKLF